MGLSPLFQKKEKLYMIRKKDDWILLLKDQGAFSYYLNPNFPTCVFSINNIDERGNTIFGSINYFTRWAMKEFKEHPSVKERLTIDGIELLNL